MQLRYAALPALLLLFQSVVTAATIAPADTNNPAQPDVTAADNGEGLQQVVVTAEKRSESLQKTPAAITAIAGPELVQTGITDLRAVQFAVPAARFQQEGNSTQVFLRGVGANLDFANVEQVVAFNVNGVYVPREGTGAPLYDVEQLEVLPGPQGTLYGRNAMGGTINVTFKRPTNSWETGVLYEAGNYDLQHVTVVQNVPLSSSLAIRAAVDYTYRSGYMETGADSANNLAARIGLRYDPGTDWSLYVWGSGLGKDGYEPGLVNKGFDPKTGTYSEDAFLRTRPWDDLRPNELAVFAPFGQPQREKLHYLNYIAGAQLDVNLGAGVTLTDIPSYTYLDVGPYNYWLGSIEANNWQHYNQATNELRLSGDSGRFKWLAGIYAYHQLNHGRVILFPSSPTPANFSDVLSNLTMGIAEFGEATYSITDRFRLKAGGRFSNDQRRANGISPADGADYTFDRSFHHFDYKVGGEFDVTDSVMTYLTYQTGYEPGTYNEVAATATKDNLVRPATLSSITAGAKSRFFDNRLQVNDEFFYYRYHDLFTQAFDTSQLFNPIFNAQEVRIPGNQLDILAKPTANDDVSLSVAYMHARNSKFVTPAGANYDGLSPPYAADWTIGGSVSHDFHFSKGYLQARIDGHYEGSWYADYVHNLGTHQPGETKWNTSLTYFSEGGSWSAGLWCENISDKAVLAATAAAGIPGPATAYLEAPRTFGLRITFNH